MKLIAYSGLVLLLVVLGLFLFTWYRLSSKTHLHISSSKELLPSDWMLETRYLTNSQNEKIAYWYIPSNNAKAIVILLHGYSNPGGKSQMIVHAKYLIAAGYSVVLVDLPSFGDSTGSKINFGVTEWSDVELIYDAIKSHPEAKNLPIGYFGISMGGSIALNTTGITQKGDFVIASVPYASIDSLLEAQLANSKLPKMLWPFLKLSAYIEFGKNYTSISPLNLVQSIHVPVLIISAVNDEELNPKDGMTIFTLSNDPKEIWEVKSKHDIHATYPEEFQSRILTFLAKYTSPKTTSN